MKITALLPAFLLLPFCLSAQNLVLNCDFSKFTLCPNDAGQFDHAEDWYTPGEGTSDLCHSCGGGDAGVPNNLWGYEQPYSGTGYGHIICYYPFNGLNYREYMEVELACPLKAGENYRVSFFVSCSDNSRFAIDGIGLLLTENALSQEGSGIIDAGMPATISQYPGVPISMKNGWMEITGIITAIGNERFITIGNFIQDDELTITEFSGSQTMYSSFYVDMVSVVPFSPMFELGPDTALCYGDSLLIDATIPCNTVYTWEDGSVNPLRNITQPGTYSIEIQIGCSVISDEIKVSWNPEPVLAIPSDTVLCTGSSVLLNAGGGYDSYLWQDGSVQPSLQADQAGIYWVEVTYGTDCHFRDTVRINRVDDPVGALGEDKTLCFGDSIVLDAGNDNIYSHYLWNDNSTGRFLTARQDGIYRVEVSNPCATVSDEIEIKFRSCIPMLTVPNAFTPNQDGLNDLFLASGVNISYFRMQVFNRWGELLFETNDLSEGWDGRKNGINCPSDVYVWLAGYESEALDIPVRETLKGNVVLVR
jgi:gliding motility-associated-like protein